MTRMGIDCPLTGEDGFDADLQAALRSIRSYEVMPPPPEPEWYGLARVFTDLADLPRGFPLRPLMPHHGIVMEEVEPLPYYATSPLPVLVSRPAFIPLYNQGGKRPVLAVGNGQVHYRRQRNIIPDRAARGTLAVPTHSTHHVQALFDAEAYAEELLRLPEAFQPVTVCLYWKDLLLEQHLPFMKKGLRVVCAGHLFDPNFTANFYRHLRAHRYVTGNAIGSHTVYALEMGIPYFLSGEKPDLIIAQEGSAKFTLPVGTRIPFDLASRPVTARLWSLLPRVEDGPGISQELLEMVSYLHGCDTDIDRQALQALIIDTFLDHDPVGQMLQREAGNLILKRLQQSRRKDGSAV